MFFACDSKGVFFTHQIQDRFGAEAYNALLDELVPILNRRLEGRRRLLIRDNDQSCFDTHAAHRKEESLSHIFEVVQQPARSPCFNVLDYSVWNKIQDALPATFEANDILEEIEKIPSEFFEKSVRDFPRRLKDCSKSKGWYFKD